VAPISSDGAADLVLDPGHAFLVGAHVGAEDVAGLAGQRRGEGAQQALLVCLGHLRVAEDHRLAAAVAEPRRRVLQGHGPGQAGALLERDVGRHAQAADGGPGGDVVDHQDAAQAEGGLLHVDDLGRAELVADLKDRTHGAPRRTVADDPHVVRRSGGAYVDLGQVCGAGREGGDDRRGGGSPGAARIRRPLISLDKNGFVSQKSLRLGEL
jgi:hypothetical protein